MTYTERVSIVMIFTSRSGKTEYGGIRKQYRESKLWLTMKYIKIQTKQFLPMLSLLQNLRWEYGCRVLPKMDVQILPVLTRGSDNFTVCERPMNGKEVIVGSFFPVRAERLPLGTVRHSSCSIFMVSSRICRSRCLCVSVDKWNQIKRESNEMDGSWS